MGKIIDALKTRFQTRDIPKTARGRFNALMRKERGDTAKVADRLGVSRRSVQRYAKGDRDISKSKPEILDRLEKEVGRDHQPRVRARAQKEAEQRGLTIETRAQFGFEAAGGSTDSARWRRMTEDVPSHLVPDVFAALRNGDEDELRKVLGQALAEEYFRVPGTAAADLDVTFGEDDTIDYIELDFG